MVCATWNAFSTGDEENSGDGGQDAKPTRGREMFAGEKREDNRESGIAGGNRANQRELADFEGAIEREHGEGVDRAGHNSPSPGPPAGAVKQVAPIARK